MAGRPKAFSSAQVAMGRVSLDIFSLKMGIGRVADADFRCKIGIGRVTFSIGLNRYAAAKPA